MVRFLILTNNNKEMKRKYFSNVFLEGITRKVEISFEVYLDKDNPEENEEILRNGIDKILKIIVGQ